MKATSAINNIIYPIIKNSLDKNLNKYKQMIGRFLEKRSKDLYSPIVCERIYYGAEDLEDFYNSLGIKVEEIEKGIQQTYYYDIAAFNPRCAKLPNIISALCIIRYFYLKKMQKELEMACIYLAFSGSMYSSIHFGSFPVTTPDERVMSYVTNNELTQKFDLKREGTVVGAIKSICLTWLDSYEDKFKNADDEDMVYLLDQLHNRIKSFMKNIAELYYSAYENRDYLNYDSDNLDEDNYRLADNDSLKAERYTEKAMEYINTTTIDYKVCKMSSDSNVKTDEVKSIMETVFSDNQNMQEVKELIRIIITQYLIESKDKDIRNIDFISKTITPKPNSKNNDQIRAKQIIEHWLEESSPAYRKRKSREATKNSYYKSILMYITLITHKSNK